MAKQQNKKITQKEKEKNLSLFSIDTTILNINAGWLSFIVLTIQFQEVFNILLISEIVLAQLILMNQLTSDQAMQTEIHRSIVKIMDLHDIKRYFTALAIEQTSQYSTAVTNSQMVDRFKEIDNSTYTQNSKFKGVSPSANMSEAGLKKYTIGLLLSIKGRLSTHPIYYATNLFAHFGLNPKNEIRLDNIQEISPFPESFETAVNFLKKRISNNNPHLENVVIETTILQDELNFVIESTLSNNKPDELDDNQEGLTEEERERIRRYNQNVKNLNK